MRPPCNRADLDARCKQLQGVVAGHKSAIRQHRQALARAKAELITLEDLCRRMGIGLVRQADQAKEPEVHGHTS